MHRLFTGTSTIFPRFIHRLVDSLSPSLAYPNIAR